MFESMNPHYSSSYTCKGLERRVHYDLIIALIVSSWELNRSMLLAAANAAGADVLDLGIARDVHGHLEGCVDKAVAEGVDVLVTSGES